MSWAFWAAFVLQDTPGDPLCVHRTARIRIVDPVGRTREIHREERVWIAPNRVRIEDLTFGRDLLILLDSRKLVLIDRPGKTHSETSFDDIASRRKAFLEELALARARVRETPEDEPLARLEQALRLESEEGKAEPTGRRESILGRPCVEAQILIDGKIQAARHFIDPSFPDGAGYLRALAAIHGLSPQSAAAARGDAFKGLPVRGVVRYVLGVDRVQSEEEVTAIERKSAPRGIFEPPEGSKVVPFAAARELPVPGFEEKK
ncbi:MAG TPA: hypothetical protein VI643_07305 [Planctomycetota bacterium]|nr:hypothetical protein [Planctomycetota bacterium]